MRRFLEAHEATTGSVDIMLPCTPLPSTVAGAYIGALMLMTPPKPWTITYNYIANVDPATGGHTGLEPGWISVWVASSGEVFGSYRPAPIPSIRKGRERYEMRVSNERVDQLRSLLMSSGYAAAPT